MHHVLLYFSRLLNINPKLLGQFILLWNTALLHWLSLDWIMDSSWAITGCLCPFFPCLLTSASGTRREQWNKNYFLLQLWFLLLRWKDHFSPFLFLVGAGSRRPLLAPLTYITSKSKLRGQCRINPTCWYNSRAELRRSRPVYHLILWTIEEKFLLWRALELLTALLNVMISEHLAQSQWVLRKIPELKNVNLSSLW